MIGTIGMTLLGMLLWQAAKEHDSSGWRINDDRKNANSVVAAAAGDDSASNIRIAGKCVDEEGMPVAGATIDLYPNADSSKSLKTTQTLPDGSFDLGDFPDPELTTGSDVNYRVVGRKEGKAVNYATVLAPSQKADSLELVLGLPAQLIGTVTGPDGSPLKNARVRVAGYPWIDGVHGAVTDNSGEYVLERIPALEHPGFARRAIPNVPGGFELLPIASKFLIVEHEDFGSLQPTFAECPATIDVCFDEPAKITGRVVDEYEKPIPGIKVTVRPSRALAHREALVRAMKSGVSQGTATTDADGQYSIAIQHNGAVEINVIDPQHFAKTVSDVFVRAGETVPVPGIAAIKAAFVSGRIVDVDTDNTVACPKGVRLRVHVMGEGALTGILVRPDGTYRLPVLPGTSYVYFSSNSLDELTKTWDVLEHPNALTAKNYPETVAVGDNVEVNFPVKLNKAKLEEDLQCLQGEWELQSGMYVASGNSRLPLTADHLVDGKSTPLRFSIHGDQRIGTTPNICSAAEADIAMALCGGIAVMTLDAKRSPPSLILTQIIEDKRFVIQFLYRLKGDQLELVCHSPKKWHMLPESLEPRNDAFILVANRVATTPAATGPNTEVSGIVAATDRKNTRSVVEAYIAAALASDVAKAASFAKRSPADRKQIETIASEVKLTRLPMKSVYVNDPAKPTTSLATSELVRFTSKGPDGIGSGSMILTLTASEEGWFVTDIDFKSEEDAGSELKQFLEANPKSIDLPRGTTKAAGTSRPLLDAVAEFNRKMEIKHPQHGQPALTDEEVIAAVRWGLMLFEKNRIAPDYLADLKTIVEQRALPQQYVLSGGPAMWRVEDHIVNGWSVSIARHTPQEAVAQTVFTVRERYLQSPKDFLKPTIKQATDIGVSLQEAINEFNRHDQKVLNKRQPPLTLDEVIAAIIHWKNRRDEVDVDDLTFQAFQDIARTHRLPKAATIEHQSDFSPGDGGKYYRWIIRIRLDMVGSQLPTTFNVRDQFIQAVFDDERAEQRGQPAQNDPQADKRFAPTRAKTAMAEDADALSNLDWMIAKEPTYRANPRYALLVMGAQSKMPIWIVHDDDRLHIDKNGNRDLTDDGPPIVATQKRDLDQTQWDRNFVSQGWELADGSRVRDFHLRNWNYSDPEDQYGLSVTVDDTAPLYAGWNALLSPDPKKAPIIHLGGPLAPKMLRYQEFELGTQPDRFSIAFATPREFKLAPARLSTDGLPTSVKPLATIQWPTKFGDSPLVTHHQLTKRCCYWEFYTERFNVPERATTGNAKVTIFVPLNEFPLELFEDHFEVPVVPRKVADGTTQAGNGSAKVHNALLNREEVDSRSYQAFIGKPVPDLKLSSLDGSRSTQLVDYQGKVVVVDFWATWCSTCYPPVFKMQTLMANNPRWKGKVELITVTVDSDLAQAASIIEKKKWINTLNHAVDINELESLGVTSIPLVMVIAPNGTVATMASSHTLDIEQVVTSILERGESTKEVLSYVGKVQEWVGGDRNGLWEVNDVVYKPIPNATLRLYRVSPITKGDSGYQFEEIEVFNSDAQGRFKINIPDDLKRFIPTPGTKEWDDWESLLLVTTSAPGFATDSTTMAANRGLDSIELIRGTSIQGRLVDELGKPVVGARITVNHQSRSSVEEMDEWLSQTSSKPLPEAKFDPSDTAAILAARKSASIVNHGVQWIPTQIEGVVTDQDGRFVIDGISPDDILDLSVECFGYNNASIKVIGRDIETVYSRDPFASGENIAVHGRTLQATLIASDRGSPHSRHRVIKGEQKKDQVEQNLSDASAKDK